MKNYIVMDLEWNQSASGKDGSLEDFPFEIIEIGAVKLNEELHEISEFHSLIRPKVYGEMHYKITEVTHMNLEELKGSGEDFDAAAVAFLDWCGQDAVFCTWGSMDLTEFQRNMTFYKMKRHMDWPLYYYDVQKLFSLLYDDGKNRQSLDVAVDFLNIQDSRPYHRALSDASYTADVMRAMEFERVKDYLSIDYFHVPQTEEEEIYMEFPSYSKYVSRVFDTKEEAIGNKVVTDMVCYRCHRMLRKKVRWFSSNQKFYFGLAVCPEHGFVKGKIRMKKTDAGKVYVVKTLKIVEENGAQQIYERKEDVKKKRHEKSRNKKLNKIKRNAEQEE